MEQGGFQGYHGDGFAQCNLASGVASVERGVIAAECAAITSKT